MCYNQQIMGKVQQCYTCVMGERSYREVRMEASGVSKMVP